MHLRRTRGQAHAGGWQATRRVAPNVRGGTQVARRTSRRGRGLPSQSTRAATYCLVQLPGRGSVHRVVDRSETAVYRQGMGGRGCSSTVALAGRERASVPPPNTAARDVVGGGGPIHGAPSKETVHRGWVALESCRLSACPHPRHPECQADRVSRAARSADRDNRILLTATSSRKHAK